MQCKPLNEWYCLYTATRYAYLKSTQAETYIEKNFFFFLIFSKGTFG